MRPSVIKATHLKRRAVVYMRQSTALQVRENQGSTEHQRGQAHLALEWGWARDQVEIIDCDLGLSGAASAHRPGFQQMMTDIRSDRVGLIICSDFSRVSRDDVDLAELCRECRIYDVLIATNGRLLDPKDDYDLLISKTQASFTTLESAQRRAKLEAGRLARVKAGKTVTHPPAGYVRLPDASWVKDPDVLVQESILAVFRAFGEAGSLRAAARLLQIWGVRVPGRLGTAPVQWASPSVPAVQRVLKNPAYAGDYVWGRRRSDPRLGRDCRGHLRTRKASPEEIITHVDHHEAYVTREVWAAVQERLNENQWKGTRSGGLGRGGALLQGIVHCGLHRGWKMASFYKVTRKNGTAPHGYRCIGDHHTGGRQCGARPGIPIDAAVVRAVLARLTTPRVQAVHEAWRQVSGAQASEDRRRDEDLRRAQAEADKLLKRLLTTDADKRHVRARYEDELERTQARIEILSQGRLVRRSAVEDVDDVQFEELVALTHDLPAIWSAPTTTDRDRKELLRIVVNRVMVERFDDERIELAIHWAGDEGTPTRVTVPLPGHAHRLIRQWAGAGVDIAAIARRLNEAGVVTKYQTPWHAKAVQRAVNRMREREPRISDQRRVAS